MGYCYERHNHDGILGIPWKTLGLCSRKATEYSKQGLIGHTCKSMEDCDIESYVECGGLAKEDTEGTAINSCNLVTFQQRTRLLSTLVSTISQR